MIIILYQIERSELLFCMIVRGRRMVRRGEETSDRDLESLLQWWFRYIPFLILPLGVFQLFVGPCFGMDLPVTALPLGLLF